MASDLQRSRSGGRPRQVGDEQRSTRCRARRGPRRRRRARRAPGARRATTRSRHAARGSQPGHARAVSGSANARRTAAGEVLDPLPRRARCSRRSGGDPHVGVGEQLGGLQRLGLRRGEPRGAVGQAGLAQRPHVVVRRGVEVPGGGRRPGRDGADDRGGRGGASGVRNSRAPRSRVVRTRRALDESRRTSIGPGPPARPGWCPAAPGVEAVAPGDGRPSSSGSSRRRRASAAPRRTSWPASSTSAVARSATCTGQRRSSSKSAPSRAAAPARGPAPRAVTSRRPG